MRTARRAAALNSTTSSSRACPVCGEHADGAPLCTAGAFDVYRCRHCTAEFAWPMPSAEELKAYYDRPEWFEGGEKGGYQSYDTQTEWSLGWVGAILDRFENGRELSVLDVGAGYGTHLKLAADRGWKCFGVEPSNHARQVAAERLGGAAYLVESVDELIPHRFDLILMLDTIEHLTSPYPTLYKLFSIGAISPDTVVVISTPNAGSDEARRDPAGWAYRHPPSHVVYYGPDALRYLLERLHFTRIDISGLAGPNDANNLAQAGGLLVTASGSDFAAFMQERYVPGTWSKIAEYEHVPRYALARRLVAGKAVLDFGCGTGYGAALLADAAASVTGLDIDAAAVTWARETHRRPNLTYLRAADLGAALPAKSFDVITCFEMIEHVDHDTQKAVVASFARLLRDDGVMLISTPNPETTRLYGANPFHIREMNEAELADLLAPHFGHIQILRQHVRAGVAFEQGDDTLEVLTDVAATRSVPLAFIGVCAKSAPVTLPAQIAFDQGADYIAEFMNTSAALNKARLAAYQQAEVAQSAQRQIAVVVEDRNAALKDKERARHEKNLSEQAREAAQHEKNLADAARDAALHERNVAQHERETALHERNLAQRDKETALHERNLARRDTEAALHERNLARIAQEEAAAARVQEKAAKEQALAQVDDVRMAYHHLHLAHAALAARREEELDSPRLLARYLVHAVLERWRNIVRGRNRDALVQADATRAQLADLMARPPAVAATQPPYICALVIPTKNGGALFKQVVAGLQRQSIWPQVEFIVVDSGSTDDTLAVAAAAGARCVSIAPSEFNHGATRDHAIAMTGCERVILTVQDAIPAHADTLERLVAALDDPKAAGAYARQIPQPDADLVTRRNLNSWLTGRTVREVRSLEDPGRYEAMSPIDKYLFCNFDNVCSVIRKSVWQTERFGRINFGEDIDWAERVLKAGHALVYEPAAAVVHSHDRPVAYEYKRTYVCHRKLYGQFGLQVMPSLRRGIGGWLRLTLSDMGYVLRARDDWSAKLRLLLKLPVLNAYNVFGQYFGARDEQRGRANTIKGV